MTDVLAFMAARAADAAQKAADARAEVVQTERSMIADDLIMQASDVVEHCLGEVIGASLEWTTEADAEGVPRVAVADLGNGWSLRYNDVDLVLRQSCGHCNQVTDWPARNLAVLAKPLARIASGGTE